MNFKFRINSKEYKTTLYVYKFYLIFKETSISKLCFLNILFSFLLTVTTLALKVDTLKCRRVLYRKQNSS